MDSLNRKKSQGLKYVHGGKHTDGILYISNAFVVHQQYFFSYDGEKFS